jgi:hypothetical protein
MFEKRANATLARAAATYSGRGVEYGNTWADHCQWLAMKSTAKHLGVEVPDRFFRAFALAAIVDQKRQRLEGGYKDDSVLDGIAYEAAWAEEMRVLKAVDSQPPVMSLLGKVL